MRVALFLTCVNDTLYPDTGRAVVKLLTRLGVEVDFPMAQTCCGQAHYNTGYRHEAEPLARHFSDVFGDYEAIVTPSGSCGAMVRELYPRMGERARAEGRGDTLAATLAPVVPKTYELTEFLVDVLGVTDVGAYYPHTVTYHPTCHGLRSLGLGDWPRYSSRPSRGSNCASCRARTSAAASAARSPSRTPTSRPRWAPTRCTTPSRRARRCCAPPTTPV